MASTTRSAAARSASLAAARMSPSRCSASALVTEPRATGGGVEGLDPRPRLRGSLGRAPQQVHRDPRVRETHGDAAPHGARPHHRCRTDLAGGGVRGETGDLGHLALRGERMAQRARLRPRKQRQAALVLAPQALGEGQLVGHPHRLHRLQGRKRPALLLAQGAGELLEHAGLRGLRLKGAGAPAARGPPRTSRSAKATAAFSRSPSTHSSISPSLQRLRGARSSLPSAIIVSAVRALTRRGRRWVPPAPGMMPSFTSGRPRRVPASAMRK